MSINVCLATLHPSQLRMMQSKLLRVIASVYVSLSCTSSMTPLLLHLSPCIFISSFTEISCAIVFNLIHFTLALATNVYIFFSKRCKQLQSITSQLVERYALVSGAGGLRVIFTKPLKLSVRLC